MVDCHWGTGNSNQTIRRFALCQSTGPSILTVPDGAVPDKAAKKSQLCRQRRAVCQLLDPEQARREA